MLLNIVKILCLKSWKLFWVGAVRLYSIALYYTSLGILVPVTVFFVHAWECGSGGGGGGGGGFGVAWEWTG